MPSRGGTAKNLLESLANDCVVVETEHRVGLRERLGKLRTVPLGKTPDRDHRTRAAGGLQLRGREHCVDRILLGALNEPAGVDQYGFRRGRILDQMETRTRQAACQLL